MTCAGRRTPGKDWQFPWIQGHMVREPCRGLEAWGERQQIKNLQIRLTAACVYFTMYLFIITTESCCRNSRTLSGRMCDLVPDQGIGTQAPCDWVQVL